MLLAIVLFVCVAGCKEKDMILEKEYIFHLNTEVIEEDGNKYLVVSGLCGHSAYGVNKIDYERTPNTITILIKVSAGDRGDFKIKLKLDDAIKKVLLGKNKSVLWQR
jgi:hypothetical protein